MPRYRFTLEFYPSGKATGLSMAVTDPDFLPAIESAQFEALKRGSGHVPAAGVALLEPVFAAGGPTLEGFRVRVPLDPAAVHEERFALGYFTGLAEAYRASLLKAGKLRNEMDCEWAMSAWPAAEEGEGVDAEFSATALDPPIRAGSLQAHLDRSELIGEAPPPGALKVFIPAGILRETAGLARAASPLECGGILLGRLLRAEENAELFLVVTAYIPALKAVASETELRFPPEVWRDVRAAVALRGRGEIWAGWAHSHTPGSWKEECGQCPIVRQRACPRATRLFSIDDRVLHRTVFPRAFAIALVANVLAGGEVVHSRFGWHAGRLGVGSYYRLEDGNQ
jgi:hypothetical protein